MRGTPLVDTSGNRIDVVSRSGLNSAKIRNGLNTGRTLLYVVAVCPSKRARKRDPPGGQSVWKPAPAWRYSTA
jgi:hypothetical protein